MSTVKKCGELRDVVYVASVYTDREWATYFAQSLASDAPRDIFVQLEAEARATRRLILHRLRRDRGRR